MALKKMLRISDDSAKDVVEKKKPERRIEEVRTQVVDI